uniref:Shieldin complex subunit 1 isoform X2 n=1 Tax=Camelus bactrianus TaxID=9837 RepID=A0A9W3FPZ1_CAMBA|nr:shieldin complex subunit 1 isoform X2 [Camelus dromedarius]XP_031530937.1 shieldin complex subunit 1 isoform X2 [Vicugna pacos]XP_045364526.1 shieldin complex subunit 1 isoform X2 [Camelus bactrianus]
MAAQEATPDGQSEESSALDLPSVYDIRDYVLQRPSQEANSEALGSAEALSMPCSSDVDPGLWLHEGRGHNLCCSSHNLQTIEQCMVRN